MPGLVECGTHAVVAAGIAPCARSEIAMASELLLAKVQPDMLVLADRNFYRFKLWEDRCFGSSEESVGQFRLRKPAEHVIQRKLGDPEGPGAVCFSHRTRPGRGASGGLAGA